MTAKSQFEHAIYVNEIFLRILLPKFCQIKK